jgi:CRP-like cAMP-binding protein
MSSNSKNSTNRLLAALIADDYQRLLPELETCRMQPKDKLYEPDKPIEYVYFPLSGVASLLAIMEDGTLVEVGTVGNEGMIGIPVFLGAEKTNGMAFYQVPGDAVRMKADAFRKEIKHNDHFVRILQRYTQALFTMLAQHTGCNRVHNIYQRCARWLLMTHDRVHDDEFMLTQEFLGMMLGVRRASVNEVMQTMQDEGFVRYQRGVITVIDRAGLEAAACECYAVIKEEYDRMLD